MDTEVLPEVNTAIQTPPPGEMAPPSTEAPVSLKDHAAQFDPKRPLDATPTDQVTEASPAERPRHRAKSQQATAADVPRIAELTKKLRDAERERDEWKSKAAPAPVPQQTRQPIVAENAPASTEKGSAKPTWAAFEEQIGTKYESWAAAQDAFADARDDWKEQQRVAAAQEQRAQQATAAQREAHDKAIQAHVTREQTFAASKPDYQAVTAPIRDINLPGVLLTALVRSDNSPELVYYFGQHPDVLDELILLSAAQPLTEESVALLQRRLSKLAGPAAPIASAATVTPHTPAPRPPNAMRTAPMKTGDDLPGEGHSLAEHTRAFDPKRRR